MFINFKNIISTIVTVFTVTMFFSCESNFKAIQKLNQKTFTPSGQADTINLVYTDSGKVKAILVSPKMIDYGSLENPYTEFPKGIKLTIFDDKNNKSYVDADYAVSYKKTNLIDLQGNVKITSYDNKILETAQLYYDQKNEWFFTEKHFKYYDAQGDFLQGPGVDFSKDFSIFNMQKSNGEVNNIDE
ncbi:LPS export ABC transporter periplasmic protein LptC [uncultured Flavobacterium sp.]|uniref:LPS export ABC transporter periplasmic protein LptC n=1 Tax=uncultured Flavobacterium sp. TaxID=165435 RepID=UPI0030CA31E2